MLVWQRRTKFELPLEDNSQLHNRLRYSNAETVKTRQRMNRVNGQHLSIILRGIDTMINHARVIRFPLRALPLRVSQNRVARSCLFSASIHG